MNRKNVIQYMAALLILFALGCVAAALLRSLDLREDAVAPLADGQTVAFPLCGFSLSLPKDAQVLFSDDPPEESDVLCHATIVIGEELIRFAGYANAAHDHIQDIDAQALITQYTQAGAMNARLRTFGGQRFIEYVVEFADDNARAHRYLTYETWNESFHLIFETEMAARQMLPILASIAF